MSPDKAQHVQQARLLAERMPDLVLAAKRVANAMTLGLHGRRQAGLGDQFWQYRLYSPDEPAYRIDWRRSASQDALYIKEREWETARTIWLWPDITASMAFCSPLANAPKADRAIILSLALSCLLVRAGERVGLLGTVIAKVGENAVETLAEMLCCQKDPPALPQQAIPARLSDVVIFSDFLDPADEIAPRLQHLASQGARGHLVQIVDPVEETFPFRGRMVFHEQEMNLKFLTGRAQSYQELYQDRLKQHREKLKMICRDLGWTYTQHHTDRPANEALLMLYGQLGAHI